jgi:hypothetical protein
MVAADANVHSEVPGCDRSLIRLLSRRLLIAALAFGIAGAAGTVTAPALATTMPAASMSVSNSDLSEERTAMTDTDTDTGNVQEEAEAKPPKSRWKRIWGWVLVVAYVLGFISAIDAIMSSRTEPGAIAWSFALVTVPVVSVPAYWVLGRSKFEGYVEAFEESGEEFEGLVARARANMASSVVEFETRTPGFDALRGLANMRLTRGNDAELLINGEQTFDSIIEGIGQAQEYVLVQFFIVHDDGLGRRLKDAMIERARAGVMVAFLYDELGTNITRQYRKDLRDAGVKVSPFGTRQGLRNKFQLNFRNHRKIVVVDGKTAWVGGHNVGDEYLGHDPDMTPWRDTHVKLDGPIAIQTQGVFAMDWYWARREFLGLNWEPHTAPDSADKMGIIMATGPADPLEGEGPDLDHGAVLRSGRRDREGVDARQPSGGGRARPRTRHRGQVARRPGDVPLHGIVGGLEREVLHAPPGVPAPEGDGRGRRDRVDRDPQLR